MERARGPSLKRSGGPSVNRTESGIGVAKRGLLVPEAESEGFCGVDKGVGLLELPEIKGTVK